MLLAAPDQTMSDFNVQLIYYEFTQALCVVTIAAL